MSLFYGRGGQLYILRFAFVTSTLCCLPSLAQESKVVAPHRPIPPRVTDSSRSCTVSLCL
jgi:hypothetical protein